MGSAIDKGFTPESGVSTTFDINAIPEDTYEPDYESGKYSKLVQVGNNWYLLDYDIAYGRVTLIGPEFDKDTETLLDNIAFSGKGYRIKKFVDIVKEMGVDKDKVILKEKDDKDKLCCYTIIPYNINKDFDTIQITNSKGDIISLPIPV